MNDAFQGMLFGTTSADEETADAGPIDELRLCALNVNSPNPSRAQHIVDWLLGTKSNTLVLTEMQPSDGGRHILACLQAEGFTTTCAPGWQDGRYLAVIATRGITTAPVQPTGFDPRIVAADLVAGDTTVRLVGVYGLTNGMTVDSSTRRREFQHRLLDYVSTINQPALCVAGDLNVVEPDHQPHLPAFEDHDYAFYRALLDLGLRDAYRDLSPTGGDHSWINPRFGSQRLDHTLVGPALGDLRACAYDHSTRAGELSDHAAMLTTIGLSTLTRSADQPRTS